MHITISWDIKAEEPEWSQLNKELRKCFKGYSWVKPLKTFYIIKINDIDNRKSIKAKIINLCQKNKKKINIIISPAIDSNTYSGWLPKPMWDKIKKRTEEDLDDFS